MAKIFLNANEQHLVANNATQIFANTGLEVITLKTDITGLTVDQNTERVVFNDRASDYSYQQKGNQILVYADDTLVATVPVQLDSDGTMLTFKEGTVNVVLQSTGKLTFGGTVVNDKTYTPLEAVTIDPKVVSGGNTFTLQEIPSAFKGYLWNGVNIPSILSGLQTLTLDDGASTNVADLSWYSSLYQSLLNNYQVWEKPTPVLTPTAQSKGVLEGGAEGTARTSDVNDTIQGDTFALNGAYVDGGGGQNTLIVDMKGPFAQPARLANIQTIIVQNMPNVYTGQDVTGWPVGQGDDIYPNDPVANTDAVLSAGSASMLDLSRALDVKKVIATESIGIGISNDGEARSTNGTNGNLTLLNIQNGATLRMEGNFDSGVVFHYGVGVPAVVDLELFAVHSNNGVKIASDAYKVNLASLGGQNVLQHANLGANLEDLVITGDARLVINDPMDNFAKYGRANIDASANTGGVAINVTDHENVKFTGTATIDQFGFGGGSAVLNINTGAGRDTVVLDGVNALAGTKIDGTNVILQIGSGDTASEPVTDLVDATLVSAIPVDETGAATGGRVGITSVVLEDKLVISQNQFSQLGASVFNGYRNDEGLLRVEISDTSKGTALSALVTPSDLDDVNLEFDIKEGATLTITAEELHKYVSDGGIIKGAGKLVITDAGLKFDPYEFNAGYAGGTLDDSFTAGVNLTVIRSLTGFERPGAALSTDTITIDTTTPVVAAGDPTPPTFVEITTPVTSELTTFIVKGDRDLVVTQPVDLGQGFVLNFSALTGKLRGSNHDSLTINNFEDVKAIIGNGATHDVRINVGLGGQVGKDDITKGLNSKGVQTYVVTDIHDADGGVAAQNFYVCDSTQNLTTLGLQKNAGDTINFLNVKWGVNFLMEGDGLVNYSDPLKADGYPDSSNIGTLNATFAYPGAPAVVNITNQGVDLGKTSTGTPRGFDVDGINIENAVSLTVNVQDGNAVIDNVDGNQLVSLTLTTESTKNADGAGAEGSLVIEEALPTTLTKIDATGVDGAITATLDDMLHAFTFKADNGFNLTLNGVDADPGTVITGGAGAGDILTIAGNVNLANATLDKIDAVVMSGGSEITLTADDILEIGAAKITVDVVGNAATLHVANLSTTEFSIPATSAGINLGTVTIAAATDITKPDVTLNAKTDLTGADKVVIPADTELNMTAAQFLKLKGVAVEGAGRLNITGVTQADINAGFNLSAVTATNGTITLADNTILLSKTTNLNGFGIELAKDQHITFVTDDQAHGRTITGATGATNTTVAFAFTHDQVDTQVDFNGDGDTLDANETGAINTGKYSNITKLVVLETLVEGQNVEQVLANLKSAIVVDVVKDMPGAQVTDRVVVVEPNIIVDGGLMFDDLHNDVEVKTLTLTLSGGVDVRNTLDISEAILATDGSGFKTLDIISDGAAPNKIGKIVANNNNLFDVNIEAKQDLTVTDIVFSSLDKDQLPNTEDNVATLTITGTKNVNIQALDTSDVDINKLNIINDGTGVLTLTLNKDKLVDAAGNIEIGTIEGPATLIIDGQLNLATVTLKDVSSVVLKDGANLTLTLDQIKAIEIKDFSVDHTVNDNPAAKLNVIGLDAATVFDATTLDAHINLGTVALVNQAAVTLSATTNLTGFDEIIVPKGTTLTMTAAQFQQLDGAGKIVGVDAKGVATTDYAVKITGLTQAMVDAGFDLSGVTAKATVAGAAHATTLTAISGNLILAVATNLGDFALELTGAQTITLTDDLQADNRIINGADATVALAFPFNGSNGVATGIDWNNDGAIDHKTEGGLDTGAYNIKTLQVLETLVEGQNVEQVLANLNDKIVVDVVKQMPGQLADTTDRIVVVEPNITVDGGLIFDDLHNDTAVETLTMTLKGGVDIVGSVDIAEAGPKDPNLTFNGFKTVTITSEGKDNAMDDILASGDNNLLNVAIKADEALNVGTITFTSDVAITDATTGDKTMQTAATLTITGDSAVTIKQLDVTDADIATMNVVNNSTGSLTVTGASPAFTGNVETLNLSGSGAIVFGSEPEPADPTGQIQQHTADDRPGIRSSTISKLDASALTGALTLGEIDNIDSGSFAFTSGSGKTTLSLNGVTEYDTAGKITYVGDSLNATGTWSFDMSKAAAGSILTIEDDDGKAFNANKGTLSINLGSNAGIVIDSKDIVDFSTLKTLTITDTTPTSTITVEHDATLYLTAAQASGLSIVSGQVSPLLDTHGNPVLDTNGKPVLEANGKVVITDLEDKKDADLSGITADIQVDLTENVTFTGKFGSTAPQALHVTGNGNTLTIAPTATYFASAFETNSGDGGTVALPYTLTATSSSVNEGAIATFNLTTVKGVTLPANNVLNYTLSGVDANDITGGLLTGTVTVILDAITGVGTASIPVTLALDGVKDGGTEVKDEVLTVTIGNFAVASTTVKDTSITTNHAPVAVADSVTLTSTAAKVFNFTDLTANDTDVDAGTTLTITAVSAAAKGTVTMDSAAKTVTFTPEAGYSGAAAGFTYTVSDGSLTANGNVAITVPATGGYKDSSIDNGKSVGTLTEVDASTDSFNFTDDASKTGSVSIINFGANDKISVTNSTGKTYEFASEGTNASIILNYGVDADGNAITDEIVLTGAINDGTLVYNETSLEAAVNAKLGLTGVNVIDVISFFA